MASDPTSSLIGTTVGGYQLLELIGKGGMGHVYRATGPNGHTVAVKILSHEHVANDILRTRFYLEAKLAMSIDHPNIVRAIEVSEENGRHYLAMEFIEGESLNKRIARLSRIPETEAIRYTVAVARALEKAHSEGLVHRDVKPDNILITKNNEAKLTDLGLAKKAEIDLDLTRPGRGLGTPHFMAPEQFKNAKNVDAKTDIYALGASLYVMVTGKLPFRGDGPLDTFIKKTKNLYTPAEELVPTLSKKTINVITSCMAADPRKRPASAAAIANYLEQKTAKLRLGEPAADQVDALEPVWFIKNYDTAGKGGRLRGPESTIKRHIARGQILPTALASKSKKGPYRLISKFPQFQPLIESVSFERKLNHEKDSNANTRPRTRSQTQNSAFDVRVFWITLLVGIVILFALGWYLLLQRP